MPHEIAFNARKTYYDWRIYQAFLLENDLYDDSDSITVHDLEEFVTYHIDKEDYDRLAEDAYRKY